MSVTHYEVIIVGAGSMGAAAAWYLSRQGAKVLAVDQFKPPHDQGSHYGQSRIIRKAYFEHADYVPLLERAYENWKSFENTANKQLYFETGIAYFGEPSHPTMQGVRSSANKYRIPLEELSRAKLQADFPFETPSNFQCLWEKEAGFVTPEATISSYIQLSRQQGAEFTLDEKVISWEKRGSTIHVTTTRNQYRADKVIFCAGSWTSQLLPAFRPMLKVTRQTLAWINTKDPERFALGNFPCWFVEDPQLGMLYGFPILPFEKFGGPIGLKIASHRPGPAVDPDAVNRASLESDKQLIQQFLQRYLPVAGEEIISTKTCLYTYSPDENFIIDFLPDTNQQVIVACGFSGHGFKFVPVIGEILSDLAQHGKSALPIEFLSIDRFEKQNR